jgi:hypothetical protein
MADFDIKQYDLLPDLVLTVADDGTPVDLSAASSAKLIVSNRSGILIESAVSIEDQEEEDNLGKVRYVWQSGDTDTIGTYNMEVEIMWAGQRPETFPAKGYKKLSINRDLNAGPTEESS